MNVTKPPYNLETPIDAHRVVRRALVLAAVVCRGSMESSAGNPETEFLYKRVLAWLTRFDLWNAVEPGEATLLHTPLGQLKAIDPIQAVWHVEGLAVLACALKQGKFPRHDQQVDPIDIADSVWFLSEDAEELIRTASLQSSTELEVCRELLYAIHTRLRDYLRNGGRKNFTRWVEQEWIDALRLYASILIVDDDLAIDGKPISQVKEEHVQEYSHLTFERHRAINWLFDQNASYAQTQADT